MQNIQIRSLRRLATFGALAVAGILATALVLSGFSAQASAQTSISATSGVFVGHDDDGQFQLALEDAVRKALAAAGCCDFRISYKVLETTGQHGGFLFVDDIYVKILAEW